MRSGNIITCMRIHVKMAENVDNLPEGYYDG